MTATVSIDLSGVAATVSLRCVREGATAKWKTVNHATFVKKRLSHLKGSVKRFWVNFSVVHVSCCVVEAFPLLVPVEVPVLIHLTMRHLRYPSTDVPLQPDST